MAENTPPTPDLAQRHRPPGPEAPRGTASNTPPRQRWTIPRWAWFALALAFLLNWLLAPLMDTPQESKVVPYTLFKAQASAGNVSEITTSGEEISGTFKQAVTYPPTGQEGSTSSTTFQTRVPSFGDDGLINELTQRGVTVTVAEPPGGRSLLLSILISFAPTLLFFAFMIWLLRRATRSSQGGIFSLGRSRAKRYAAESDETMRITFKDVAGIEEAEQELVEIVDFLKNPEKYQRLGGTIPKGVLLVGPPGTGKTLLAKAVAGEAEVPFFSMSGSEFIEMVVGVGASRVRELFSNAKNEAPAIIFVDELDAIGRRRGSNVNFGGSDEREQTLNQILVEMDGFDSRNAVIVLAATNRPDVLDPALLRPGRFDRRVTVQRPDRVGRKAILEVHTRGVPLDPNLSLETIAEATPGLVGADLRNLVNEAALLAARRERPFVTQLDFFDAMEKIILGAARQLVLNEDDRRRVAYHEAGHAILGLLVPDADPVHKVTIVPRGQALGVTYSVPADDRFNYTERYLRGRIVGALGGRAAEEIVFNDVTTGAENDLKQVMEIARQMVTKWGMSKEVGLLYLSPNDGEDYLGSSGGGVSRDFGEELTATVDKETRRIIDESYQDAIQVLIQERHRLDALAEALLERESLDEPEILQVVGLPAKERNRPALVQVSATAAPHGLPPQTSVAPQ